LPARAVLVAVDPTGADTQAQHISKLHPVEGRLDDDTTQPTAHSPEYQASRAYMFQPLAALAAEYALVRICSGRSCQTKCHAD